MAENQAKKTAAAKKTPAKNPPDTGTEEAAADQAGTATATASGTVSATPRESDMRAAIAKAAGRAGIKVLMPRLDKDGKPKMKPRVGTDGEPEDSAVYDAAERAPAAEDILAFKVTGDEARFVTADGRKHTITA